MLSRLMFRTIAIIISIVSNIFCAQIIIQKSPKLVKAVRISNSIEIDGKLKEKAWEKAEILLDFMQREPEEGKPVSERTEVRIIYDDKNLYFGVRCWDSQPNLIIANEMRRDVDLINNDCIEIYLDTYHDHRTAFVFCTNALGAQRDGIIIGEVGLDEQNWNWNGTWQNACEIDSEGWTAEIAIPFKTLRFGDDDEKVWGLNIARYIPRKREEAFWSPILRDYGSNGIYKVSAYGDLSGLEQLKHPSPIEFKPYFLAGADRDFQVQSTYKSTVEAGLDIKYHPNPNLTTDLSLNTDFAQVEADQEQANLTRFELYFPEKRDFFLEGAGIFRFSERSWSVPAAVLFFSRRIGLSEDNQPVPLLGGIKLSGKSNKLNIGLLNVLANRTTYMQNNISNTIPKTNFTALRLQYDILTGSTLGLIGLNKQSLDNNAYNRTFGVDANIFLSNNTQASVFIAKTITPNLYGKDLAAYADFFYADDFWTLLLAQNTIQNNFNAEMGYVPRPASRRSQINFGVSPRPGILNIRQLTVFNDFYYITNQQSELITRFNTIGLWIVFNNGATFLSRYDFNYEHLTDLFQIHKDVIIPEGIYSYNNFYGEYVSDRGRDFSGKINLNAGQFYDGKITGYGFETNLKIGPRFTVNVTYNRNDVMLTTGSFTTTLVGMRFLYTFSTKLFAKAYIQWNSERNIIISNLLIGLIHSPGSDLFLVYNEELTMLNNTTATKVRAIKLKFTYLI